MPNPIKSFASKMASSGMLMHAINLAIGAGAGYLTSNALNLADSGQNNPGKVPQEQVEKRMKIEFDQNNAEKTRQQLEEMQKRLEQQQQELKNREEQLKKQEENLKQREREQEQPKPLKEEEPAPREAPKQPSANEADLRNQIENLKKQLEAQKNNAPKQEQAPQQQPPAPQPPQARPLPPMPKVIEKIVEKEAPKPNQPRQPDEATRPNSNAPYAEEMERLRKQIDNLNQQKHQKRKDQEELEKAKNEFNNQKDEFQKNKDEFDKNKNEFEEKKKQAEEALKQLNEKEEYLKNWEKKLREWEERLQQKEIDLAKKVLDEEEAPKKFHYNYEEDENVDPFDFEEDDDKKTKGKKMEVVIPSKVMASVLDILKNYPCYTGCKQELTKAFRVGKNMDKWLFLNKEGKKVLNDQYIKNHLLPALAVIILYQDMTYVSIQGRDNVTYHLPGIGNKNPISTTQKLQIKSASNTLLLPEKNSSIKIKFGLSCPVYSFLKSLSLKPPASYSYILEDLVIKNCEREEAFIMTINSPKTLIFQMLELCYQIENHYSALSFAFDSINSYDAKLKKANKQLEELTKKLSTAKIYEKGQINKELQTTNDSILKYKQIKEKYLQEQMKTSAILNNALKTLEKNKAAIQKESEQTIEKIIKEYSK